MNDSSKDISWLKTIAFQAPGVLGVIVIVWIFVQHLNTTVQQATLAINQAATLLTTAISKLDEIDDSQRELRACCDGEDHRGS